MTPKDAQRRALLPRDDVAEDFVREFLGKFGAEPSAEVSEAEDSFTVRLKIGSAEQGMPEIFVVADTVRIHASQRTVALVIIRCGGIERWLLLPGVIDADRVRSQLIDGVLLVTLPKSTLEV